MTTRSIDRKLEALQKRIDAERNRKPVERPPTEGLTNHLLSTADKDAPLPRQKGPL